MADEQSKPEQPGHEQPMSEEERIAQVVEKLQARKRRWNFKFTHNHVSILIVLFSAIVVRMVLFSTHPQLAKVANIVIAIALYHGLLSLDAVFYRSRGYDYDAAITRARYGPVLRWGFYALALAHLLGLVMGGVPGA